MQAKSPGQKAFQHVDVGTAVCVKKIAFKCELHVVRASIRPLVKWFIVEMEGFARGYAVCGLPLRVLIKQVVESRYPGVF